jgi:hypothetical protein
LNLVFAVSLLYLLLTGPDIVLSIRIQGLFCDECSQNPDLQTRMFKASRMMLKKGYPYLWMIRVGILHESFETFDGVFLQ